MLRDARLVLRLLASSRGSALARAVLTVLGVVLAVVATLTVLALPQAIAAGDARVTSRAPTGEVGQRGMRFYATTELVGERLWTRASVTDVDARSPLPPGVSRWPRPGEALVSPALMDTLRAHGRESSMSERVVGIIGPPGLRAPDELLSYAVNTASGGSDVAITGFGDPRSATTIVTPLVLGELLVLVLLPEMFYLLVVLRLSYGARRDRTAAMSLIGVDEKRLGRMFAGEMAVLTGVGAVVGAALFVACEPWLARSGVLGISWHAGDGSPQLLGIAGAVLVQMALVWWLSFRAMRAVGRRTLGTRGVAQWAGARGVVGAALVAAAVCAAAALVGRARSLTGSARALPEEAYVPTALGLLVMGLLGMLLVSPAAVRAGAGLMSRARIRGVRLGGRTAQQRAQMLTPLSGAVAAGLVLGGMSMAALEGARLDGVGDVSSMTVEVQLDGLSAETRAQLAAFHHTPHVVMVGGEADGPPGPYGSPDHVGIEIATCADHFAMQAYLPRDVGCRDEPMLADPKDPTGGRTFQVQLTGGRSLRLKTPTARMSGYSGGGILIPPSQAPWAFSAQVAMVQYQTSMLDGSYERLLSRLHELAPEARPQSSFKDPSALAGYYEHRSLLGAGISIGFTLVVLALVMLMLDLRWESARSRANLVALGAPFGQRLLPGLTQATIPVVVAVLLAGPLTALVCNFFTAYWGPTHLWTSSVLVILVVLSAAAFLGGMAAGVMLTVGRLRLTDLADE